MKIVPQRNKELTQQINLFSIHLRKVRLICHILCFDALIENPWYNLWPLLPSLIRASELCQRDIRVWLEINSVN